MFNSVYLRYIFFPLLLFWFVGMYFFEAWGLYFTKWLMALTMAAGSFVAGSTSIGGGAVAFPVMTLIFNIDPSVARDFSLIIQSVGMLCAVAALIIMRVKIEKKILFWTLLGGGPGIIFGYDIVAPLLDRPLIKVLFGSFVFSFGLMLWWVNRGQNGHSAREGIGELNFKINLMFLVAGFFGGIISGILGSGIDIVIFSILVLRFGVCEKIATPTSVVLMALTALTGALWAGGTGQIAAEAWEYWWVCVPIVAFGAPLGSWCATRLSRINLVRFLYALIFLQYIGTILIVPQSVPLLFFNVGVVCTSLLLFWRMDAKRNVDNNF